MKDCQNVSGNWAPKPHIPEYYFEESSNFKKFFYCIYLLIFKGKWHYTRLAIMDF